MIFKKKLKNTQNCKKNSKEEKTLNLKASIMPRLQRNIEKLKQNLDIYIRNYNTIVILVRVKKSTIFDMVQYNIYKAIF